MYKRSATELKNLSRPDFKNWLDSFDFVLTDCDGVLWLQDTEIPDCPKALKELQDIGKIVYLVTNNSRVTRKGLVEKAQNFGITVDVDNIVCTAHETAAYLKAQNFQGKLFCIGNEGISAELTEVGIKHIEFDSEKFTEPSVFEYIINDFEIDPDVTGVVVGFDDKFDIRKMTLACTYLSNPECIFIATNTDERFPIDLDVVMPGTGSIVKSVETCTDRTATVIGKPNKNMVASLIANGLIKPERTLMIGDRCNTDIVFGHNCGFQTLLVGTGIHNLEYLKPWLNDNDCKHKIQIPDFYIPKLSDLSLLINLLK